MDFPSPFDFDPPLHEFLPHIKEGVAALSEKIGKPAVVIREITRNLMEVNPMLGFRGCRLSVIYPEITDMQVRAIISAAADANEEGINARPEIMIPLVVNVREVRLITEIIEKVRSRGYGNKKCFRALSNRYDDGNTSSLSHREAACSEVEFMSFGTNDLTQMTYGFSRDDAGMLMPEYLDKNLIGHDPFVSLDTRAVGDLGEDGHLW